MLPGPLLLLVFAGLKTKKLQQIIALFLLYNALALFITVNATPAPPINASPNEKSAIGINLTGLSYWSSQWMTIDIMHQASNGSGILWATTNADTYVYNTGHQSRLNLDDQGWPKTLPERDDPDFHYVTTILYQNNQDYQSGEYLVLYDGEGQLSYNGVTRIAAKSSPGRDVVQLDADSFFHLQIRVTDPNNSGDHLRNIRILVPGGICGDLPTAYALNAADCSVPDDFNAFERIYQHLSFHPLFLQDLAKYRALRFMQMMRTNVSEQYHWADRPKYDYASWSMAAGAPIELAIDLANKTQAEPWLNVPARVDDNYMLQYAQLVKDSLDPHLNVYIELGNEIWNNAYPYNQDAQWMEQQGLLLWPEAQVSPFEYRLNYYGKRTADLCDIFKQVFAGQASRVKCVLASQGGNSWVGNQALSCPLWAAQNGGQNCALNIDSLAIGPYFGGYIYQDKFLSILSDWLSQGDAGMTKLFEEINTGLLRDLTYDPDEPDWQQAPEGGSLAQSKRFIEENKVVADNFGIKLTAYEGGQHLTFAGNLSRGRAQINDQLFLAGNRDPRMGAAFYQHFSEWKNAGASLYMVFESTARWGDFGAFPLKEYQLQPLADTPKLAQTLAFIDDTPCWWSDCDRLTQVYDRVPIDSLPGDPQLPEINLAVALRLATRGVALSWAAITAPVLYYKIYRDDVLVGHTNADTSIFNNDWLELHQAYDFQVKAVDSTGVFIAESNIITTLAGDSVAPTSPTALTVSFDGNYGFTLSWMPSVDEAGIAYYLIHRNGLAYTHVSGTETSFADEWPPQGEVSYQIFAEDLSGNVSLGSEIVICSIP